MRLRRSLSAVLVAFALSVTVACHVTPPPAGLSPAGITAFNQTRLVKALDTIRDTAISANAQPKPLISTDDTRAIVTLHETALKTIQASANGWQDAVRAAVDNGVKALSASTQALLAPDVALFDTLLGELK